jgi:peptide deformylase
VAVKPILVYPDQRLYTKSVAVPPLAVSGLRDLIKDMWDTCYAAYGLGLAAIQIGVAMRVAVMDVYQPGQASKQYVFINPAILAFHGAKELKNEGCLSVPGVLEQVERHDAVQLSYLDENGLPQVGIFTGLEAQCVQHEVEHLDGVLLPDKLSYGDRERIKKLMKERKK